MSSGGVAQLVAVGAQDVWLTGSPEVSFFQSNYKRHTNFSHVVDRQTIQGNPSAGGMSSVRFDRKGDMLSYVYLTANNGSNTYTCPNWSNLISYTELYIGGQLIDKQDSTFTEYLAPDLLAQNLAKSAVGSFHGGAGTSSFFYPLRYFFCENWQSSLPLVALQYHDVEVRIYWGPNVLSDLGYSGIRYNLFANYIFLDDNERDAVTHKPHNMLITQVQSMNPANNKVQEVVMNHPMKYLASAPVNGTALVSNSNRVLIQINGTDVSDFKFACPNFTTALSYYHAPFSIGNDNAFFVYPFCLDTSKLQPTGTLNFSRLDSFRIVSETTNITDTIYGVNYNILRIENGMGGLVYSN